MDFWQGIITLLDKYGVQTVVVLILLILLLRTAPGFFNAIADMIRARATASATKQAGEVQNDAKVLDILQMQVSNGSEINKILLGYQKANEQVAAALTVVGTETKGMRTDFKFWLGTSGESLAESVSAIEEIKGSFEAMKSESDTSHKAVLEILHDQQVSYKQMVSQIAAIYGVHFPPPPLPHDQTPVEPSNILHADAGAQAPDIPLAS